MISQNLNCLYLYNNTTRPDATRRLAKFQALCLWKLQLLAISYAKTKSQQSSQPETCIIVYVYANAEGHDPTKINSAVYYTEILLGKS